MFLLAKEEIDFTEELLNRVQDHLSEKYFGSAADFWVWLGIVLIATFVVTYVVHFITKKIVVGILRKIAKKTKTKWDDFLIERKLFSRLAHLGPAIIIYLASDFYPASWWTVVERFAFCYMVLVGILAVLSVINALSDIYNTLKISRTNPIKGFIGGAKIFVFIMGGVFLLATALGKDPSVLLAGIGAITAVLLLVFKDSILGLVASIQIITNDLVNVGDWISMPKYDTDGDVIDISLTTIKVQNWDKTITTIPTYALIADSFKNWRGMEKSAGRRIKRSVSLDMSSVQFLTKEMIARFGKISLLTDYIQQRGKEVEEYNREHKIDTSEIINGRRLTNLGTFRAYVKAYLEFHPKINREMTLLIRQLAPDEKGIPIEIYVFSSDKRWLHYEDIQADIFDHLLAVIPEFELRVFQNPTGNDIREITAN